MGKRAGRRRGLVWLGWVGVVALVAVAAVGCATPKPAPVTALDRYSSALRSKDYSAAYGLMSEQYQAQHSLEEFTRMMKGSGEEVAETAARLSSGSKDVRVAAEFRYGASDSMRLIQEDGQWRIDSNPLDFYSQATPREALRSFLRAYSLKRWEIMLRFVPAKYRERMDAKMVQAQFEGERREEAESMMNALIANQDAPISEKGGEARMPYSDRFEVKFVIEDGLWMIQDLD